MVSSSGKNANDLVFRRYHANAVATGRWKLSVRFSQRWLAKEGSVVSQYRFFKLHRVLEHHIV